MPNTEPDEPSSLWQKIVGFFQSQRPLKPRVVITKKVSVTTMDKAGERHEYHSLDELPPDLQDKVEQMQAEALSELNASPSEGRTATSIYTKTNKISVFKVKDASGNERVYHSLEELPPDIRAAFEKLQNKSDT